MAMLLSRGEETTLDPIMAIDELFRADKASNKLNLVVGVFQNEDGETPVLSAVKSAEALLVTAERTKAYLPIAGEASFISQAESLVFGAGFRSSIGNEIASVQTPGSTGALRIAAELIKQSSPHSRVWVGIPAYSNHRPIFTAAGLGVADCRYYDPLTGKVLFEEMLSDLSKAAAGDVVLLHACCHNPTGSNLTIDQWSELAHFCVRRSLLPLVDAAYLGLGTSIDADAAGLRVLAGICREAIIATSFSKTFALYSERVGLLSFVGDKDVVKAAERAKVSVRAIYTSPPSHGACVVSLILADGELRRQWLLELDAMRSKLLDVRLLLADTLDADAAGRDIFPSLRNNRGMFTLSRLTRADVQLLRQRHHIYVLDNGRLSFGGLRRKDIQILCSAITDVSDRRARSA
jgi:aspartate/tyrosine/aromatic aminotransferase